MSVPYKPNIIAALITNEVEMHWDLKKLLNGVDTLHGESQRRLLSESTNSIVQRQGFANFHFDEALALFNGYFQDKKTLTHAITTALMRNSKDYQDFQGVLLRVQAHVLGFMQSLHSISDILSHVIYYSLGINEIILDLTRVSIGSMLRVVRSNADYLELSKLINEMLDHSDYDYLAGVVNHSKHRSIIMPRFSANLQKLEGEYHELKFKAFEYKAATYPQRLVFEFMRSEYDRQSKLIVAIGCEINKIVYKKL